MSNMEFQIRSMKIWKSTCTIQKPRCSTKWYRGRVTDFRMNMILEMVGCTTSWWKRSCRENLASVSHLALAGCEHVFRRIVVELTDMKHSGNVSHLLGIPNMRK